MLARGSHAQRAILLPSSRQWVCGLRMSAEGRTDALRSLRQAQRTKRSAARALRAIAVCSSLALAAVSLGCRHFEPAPLSPAESAAALENRSLADPGLRSLFEKVLPNPPEQWPLEKWDLTALTLVALYFQPSLDLARAQSQVAQAGVATAGARPNPTLSFLPQYVSNTDAGVGPSPWLATVSLDWPIETAGKRGYRIERAQELASAAELALDNAAWQVRARVRAQLLDFVAARERALRLAEEVASEEQVVALLEERVRLGAASQAELAPARLAALQSSADLAEVERQRAEAWVRFAEALGLTPRALEGIEIDFSVDTELAGGALAGLSPEEIRREGLQNRADLKAALAEYEATQSALQLEIARQYPDVRIGPGYEYDQGLNKWAVVGISVELPVMNRNEGPIGEAQARRSEAAARFVALQAQAIAEIDRALANQEAAREALRRSESLISAEHDRVRATEQALRAGAVDRLALRTAQAEAARAERIRLDAKVRVQQATGDLEAAVQQPVESAPPAPPGRGAP
jgi:outer membrane protein, heavy metal efflux system